MIEERRFPYTDEPYTSPPCTLREHMLCAPSICCVEVNNGLVYINLVKVVYRNSDRRNEDVIHQYCIVQIMLHSDQPFVAFHPPVSHIHLGTPGSKLNGALGQRTCLRESQQVRCES